MLDFLIYERNIWKLTANEIRNGGNDNCNEDGEYPLGDTSFNIFQNIDIGT